MQKKESEAQNKETYRHNWVHFLVVLIIAIVVLLIFTNGFFSGTAGAVRSGGGTKSYADLIPNGAVLQNIEKKIIEGKLFFHIQEGVGVANMGTARSKASVLRAGIRSDSGNSLQNVRATVSYLDSTGKLVTSATTQFLTLTNNDAYIDIPIDSLMPYDKYKWGDSFSVLFLDVPINMPSPDGAVTETKYTLFGDADATKVVTESNENNNHVENGYIIRCAFQDNDLTTYPYAPTCCLHRVDSSSPRYIMYGTYYCEDYPSYDPVYTPVSG